MNKNSVKALTVRYLPSTSFNPLALVPVGGQLEHACFLIRIINNTAIFLWVSYDGFYFHDALLPNSTIQISFQANSSPTNQVACLAAGSIISVNGLTGAPGTGEVIVAGYYQEQQ